MKDKKRKEIEEIAYKVAKQVVINSLPQKEACNCDCEKENQAFKADKVARDDMFKKLATNLPAVYNENNPILVRRYSEWLSLITRAHFNNEPLFDEMNLTEIKNYFAIQLGFYYNDEVERVLKLHATVLKEYYVKKERGSK